MELYENIKDVLSKKGVNLLVTSIYDYMEIWKSWYRGNVSDFHFYNVVVNGKTEQKERLTMNMPKKICEDISKLLWTEKTKVELSNQKATKRLWEILDSKKNNFTINFPMFIEKSLALGTGVLIEYKDNNDETIIDYVYGDMVIPYKYTNGYINGLVTISRFMEKGRKNIYFTHITYHEFNGKVYRRYNELYKSSDETQLGKEVDFKERFTDVKQLEEIETKIPRFQVFKPNLANNLDLSSPMGISILANSVDRFKSLDIKFDSFYNEFKLSRKRILVDPTAMKAQTQSDLDGNIRYVQYFDTNDEVYVGVNGMEDQPIKDIDFTLRANEHIESINADLNWLSANVGLGNNFYKFNGTGVKTATEVMSENADAFRTKVHYDIITNDVIYDLVSVICEMDGIKTNKITIIPDDSIIEDKNAEQMRALQEVAQGLRSKISYLTEIKGLTEQEAQDELDKITEEKQQNVDNFFGDNTDVGEE